VLPGDHAQALPTLPAGTYPAWSRTTSYKAGVRVLFRRLPYVSKWDNEGVSPAAACSSPWKPLYRIPGEPAS
jgi:chitinase